LEVLLLVPVENANFTLILILIWQRLPINNMYSMPNLHF